MKKLLLLLFLLLGMSIEVNAQYRNDEIGQNTLKSLLLNRWNASNKDTREATQLGYRALILLAANNYRLDKQFGKDLLKVNGGVIGYCYAVIDEIRQIWTHSKKVVVLLRTGGFESMAYYESLENYITSNIDETKEMFTDGIILVAQNAFKMKDNERLERLDFILEKAKNIKKNMIKIERVLRMMKIKNSRYDEDGRLMRLLMSAR